MTRRLFQGKGLEPLEARKVILSMFAKHGQYGEKPLLVGPISMEIGLNYGLNETEALLEEMVREGLLRRATSKELGSRDLKGYIRPARGVLT
jgi:hypothetical protein